MIVPFPAGGLVDSFARPFAARVQQQFGQPAVVENRVGAGGNIGADLVAKSAPMATRCSSARSGRWW
jgi:tripartite-type tricarboxylate transporter receptor subunit TctC